MDIKILEEVSYSLPGLIPPIQTHADRSVGFFKGFPCGHTVLDHGQPGRKTRIPLTQKFLEFDF